MKCIALLLIIHILLFVSPGNQAGIQPKNDPGIQPSVETEREWPYPVPCRISDGSNKDLFIMTLGDITTPLADGIFNPAKDEVRLEEGTVKSNYYRDILGIKYYKPIDKSIFPLPPSGLCTWYYYYQHINETEVKRNALWIAKNLKDYGAQYVQIDDGWQGETKEGRHGSRDWTTIDKAFPGGMESLAAYIKSLGLTPGIWLAPHGQSNEDVVKSLPGVFLFKPDGTSASKSWEGPYLVDPSTTETQMYMKELFTRLVKWGYDYFKIDGQPVVVDEFRKASSFMKNPGDVDTLYRETLERIRSAIGPERYLLGCWGIPLEGVGIMNGSRTGGDVVLGWSGFKSALWPTMRYYYMHNIVWYTDPDVMLLRQPLTLDQARAWATLQGLTGQALMASDRLMDLSENRVELMRRVYPAVDIRPLDLFPSERNKRIWDLKINHLNRSYDVVGIFNFEERESEQIVLDWKDLGLSNSGPVHVFDFWNNEYIGAWEAGMCVDVAPTSCRVLTLVPDSGRIQLVSTNRHITQGWVDLVALDFHPEDNSFSGRSRVIKNDPYQLHFAFPRGKYFAVRKASARSSSANLPVKIFNHQGWAMVQIDSPQTTEVSWSVAFEPADSYRYETREPRGLSIERVGLDGINLRWYAQYYLNAGYQVYLDGQLLGYAPGTTFPIRGLDPNRTYTADVRTVWDDGTINKRREEKMPDQKAPGVRFSLASMIPQEISLSELNPVHSPAGPIAGLRQPLSLAGKSYPAGIVMGANQEIEYDLKGLFSTFTALVGVDDRSADKSAGIEFLIVGDGKEIWRSGILQKSDGAKTVEVSITGVQRLIIRVTSSDRRFGLAADWVEARLVK